MASVAAPHLPAPRELAVEATRYLGAAAIVVVGVIHAQQYYDAYFNVVPTIGTLFLLSFIGSGVVGAILVAPVRSGSRSARSSRCSGASTRRSSGSWSPATGSQSS